jgi:hypothetical protein
MEALKSFLYQSLTWKWGENPHHFPSPMAYRPGEGAGGINAYTYANSQVPQVHVERNFHPNLKDLQFERSSLGLERMG